MVLGRLPVSGIIPMVGVAREACVVDAATFDVRGALLCVDACCEVVPVDREGGTLAVVLLLWAVAPC